MPTKTIFIFLFSLCFLSCDQSYVKSGNVSYVPADSSMTLITKTDSLVNKNAKNLLSIAELHHFSDTIKPDTFFLTLVGKSIVDGQLYFKIKTSDNRTIHAEDFPASDLLWDEVNAIPTNKLKADTIKRRMQRFFSAESFIQPAIKIASPFNEDNSDKKIWDEINSNEAAVGFIYTYGYEGTYGIAYSKTKQKAVLYFSSD